MAQSTESKFAVVFNDTVFGIGDSPAAARQDALEWTSRDGTQPDEMEIVEISSEQIARVEAGETTWHEVA